MEETNKMTKQKPKTLDDLLKAPKNQILIQKEIEKLLPSIVKSELESQKKNIIESVTINLTSHTKEVSDRSFDDLRKKLEQDRLSVIQATSIITLFIGFLVIQFNILGGSKGTTEIAGLSLLLLSSIIIFIILLDIVIKLDLPFRKVEKRSGVFDGIDALAGIFQTRNIEVPITIYPSTWGDGLLIRVVALSFSIFIGGVGVLLIAVC